MKRTDTIVIEARRITKWNKKRFNRQLRRAQKAELFGKGCQYKRNSFDARLHTMA